MPSPEYRHYRRFYVWFATKENPYLLCSFHDGDTRPTDEYERHGVYWAHDLEELFQQLNVGGVPRPRSLSVGDVVLDLDECQFRGCDIVGWHLLNLIEQHFCRPDTRSIEHV